METSVEDWLSSIKMERYVDHFQHAGYTRVSHVTNLLPKDLVDMGIVLIGHQKKIMSSIQSLRTLATFTQIPPDGFLV